MEANGLRQKALQAIDETRWIPPQGRNRIEAMVESRPDWCVSRQRAWGVPIPVFTNRKTGEPLRDPAVVERVAAAVEREGADVWFTTDAARFLGNEYDPAEWEKVTDIIEVWFDSGSTHAFVLEKRPELRWPASLYLEGSDQHRGWFHSSLIEACGTRGRAPYEAVLTHGFVLDEDGRKMSKSLGNVIAPQEVMQQSGADILRLWVVGSDYAEDLRIGPEILKHMGDAYRRLRNTLRYLLGALAGFTPDEAVPPRGDAGARALGVAPPGRARRAGPAARSTITTSTACSPRCIISARSICRRSISTSARTGSIATRPTIRRGARRGRCSTAPSIAWRAGWRRSCALPPRRLGSPATATRRTAASISNCFADVPAGWRDPALGGALGRIARSAAGRDRRARSRARREAHRVEPAGRGRDLRPGAAAADCCATSTSPSSASPRRERCGRRRRRRAPSRLPDVPDIGVVVTLAAGRALRALLAGAAGGRPCRRAMTICAGAAPRSLDRGAVPLAAVGRRDDRPPVMLARGLAVAAVVAMLDQLSKAWVLHFFGETGCAAHYRAGDLVLRSRADLQSRHQLWPVQPLRSSARWSSRSPAAAIIVVLLFWLSRVRSRLLAIAIGLIIGGAVGNVIDRLRFGAVVDFLDFHVGSWHWPAFNLADSAICLGVAAMLLDGVLSRREATQAIHSERAIQGEDVSR